MSAERKSQDEATSTPSNANDTASNPNAGATSGADVRAFKQSILAKLKYAVGKDPANAYIHDWFEAIALAARDHLVDNWEESEARIDRKPQKRVYYLSLEFYMGRTLSNTR